MKKFYNIMLIFIIIASCYLAIEIIRLSVIKEGLTNNNTNTTNGKSEKDSNQRYNKDNLDIKYHEDPEKLDEYGLLAGTSYVRDNSGNVIALPPTGSGTRTTYYDPNQFKYGALTYVPKYEDSVFLSRTSNMFIGNNVLPTSSIKGGICNFYKSNLDELESSCQKTDPNVCASTSCCVLLGGAKCVSGSETGPTMVSHYNNKAILNRDYYYYQGKCYGNCPPS
jgi:hypothetical protein